VAVRVPRDVGLERLVARQVEEVANALPRQEDRMATFPPVRRRDDAGAGSHPHRHEPLENIVMNPWLIAEDDEERIARFPQRPDADLDGRNHLSVCVSVVVDHVHAADPA